MIVEGLLDILGAVIDNLILLIPNFVIDAFGGFAGIIDAITKVSFFMPLTTLGLCIGIWISFQMFDFGYQAVMWVVRKIPGIS